MEGAVGSAAGDLNEDVWPVPVIDIGVPVDAATAALVSLEMECLENVGHYVEGRKRRSVDRIFGRYGQMHVPAIGGGPKPRRSTARVGGFGMRLVDSDDDEETGTRCTVPMLLLGIGEMDPELNTLVLLELAANPPRRVARTTAKRRLVDLIFRRHSKTLMSAPVSELNKLRALGPKPTQEEDMENEDSDEEMLSDRRELEPEPADAHGAVS